MTPRPLSSYVATWIMAYMALRDVSGLLLTVHKVPWLHHPLLLSLLVGRGGTAIWAAVELWRGGRHGVRLGVVWLIVFSVLVPLAWFPWNPYATLRSPLPIALPSLAVMGWEAWTRRRAVRPMSG